MARRTQTPDTSSISRTHTLAYARKKNSGGGDDCGAGHEDDVPVKDMNDAKDVTKDVKAAKDIDTKDKTVQPKVAKSVIEGAEVANVVEAAQPVIAVATPIVEAAKEIEPEIPARTGHATLNELDPTPSGKPPEMPVARASSSAGIPENPTHMPNIRDIPAGKPEDPEPPPGLVPRGDSRSLRRAGEFALIYRLGNAVITRFGAVGTRGQWRVVEYPTSASASHTYARECSRFLADGFADYREDSGAKNTA